MATPKILALVLAGGEGSRLGPLTRHRAKPVVSFGGVYRLIDFAISNLVHSGVTDVWVVQQYQPFHLNKHLANGRPWDLDRNFGGLMVMPPHSGGDGEGFAEGNADALHRQSEFIREMNPDLVITMSADHVYQLDLKAALNRHRKMGLACTMVTTELPGHDLTRYSVVQAEDNVITKFDYKPSRPKGELIGTELFVYETQALLDTLEELSEKKGLKDYGHELLPHFVKRRQVAEYRHRGYWRDVGTLKSFLQGHLDLVGDRPALQLDDPAWPIRTATPPRMPARILKHAIIEDSLISPGARIEGTVIRSVIGPGAYVEKGAMVVDSVVLPEARVAADLKYAIVDEDAVVLESAEGTLEEPVVIGAE